MSSVFGIHVGNTSACLALAKDGKIEVIANDSGDRVTPAVVTFSDSETVVGSAAKSALARNLTSSVVHNKQLLDASLSDEQLEEIAARHACAMVKVEESCVKYEIKKADGKLCVYSPEDVATHIFRKLFAIASSTARPEADLRAVLCVPLQFPQASRQAVMRAAEEAGFDVLQVVSEPSAAALAYGVGLQDAEEESHCLVYRAGGTSLDATLLQVNSGMYTVLATVREPHLGGDRFTKVLVNFLAAEFAHRWKLDPQDSRRSMTKLTAAAETCKHVLSTVSTAHCFVESLCEGVDFSHNITRARFENLIAAALPEYVEPVRRVLVTAGVDASSVGKLVLCGGSVKIPKLQQVLGDLFPGATKLCGLPPDEVVATGAAKHGSYMSCSFDPDCEHLSMEIPAVSRPLYARVAGQEELRCVIPALTPVPVRRIHTHEVQPAGSEITVELHEKESKESEASRFLTKATLASVKDATQVVVEVSINSMGGLHLVLTEPKSQVKASVKLEAPGA
ncbi:heat shock 70 kDa protein 14-like [Bacillus rossius redtenbacheri]|uniref:heat shock 70 kDa protein 14-like n=1 Tax=Bacillus rossius redtenbacheri TaxID=93214 RepID=UPI002FDF057A